MAASRPRKLKATSAAPADPAPHPPVPVLRTDPDGAVSAPVPTTPVVVPSYRDAYPGRLFEWMTACMMIGVALVVLGNPKSIAFGGFYLMADIGLTAPVLGVIFLVAGIARVVALIANGAPNWCVYGPRLRAAGAIVGVVIWAQMLHALILWSTKQGYLSIGVAVYLFLAVGEAISCYRAASDVRPRNG